MGKEKSNSYITFVIDNDLNFYFSIDKWLLYSIFFIFVVIIFYLILKRFSIWGFRRPPYFEIDSAELGLSGQKFKFRPNYNNQQVAYNIWVELSTRKIGLDIDLEHDVIAEVYNSWYEFFGVTRELIKDIPVSLHKKGDTGKIIQLSIEVLNEGIRPHLTKWQASFRRWYELELQENRVRTQTPQDIQKKFPGYKELEEDILRVNKNLIKYREKMYSLVIS